MSSEVSLRTALELSCAAQRVNGAYHKEIIWNYESQKMNAVPNRDLIALSLGIKCESLQFENHYKIVRLTITDEDRNLANDIQKYYRRLTFTVMAEPANEFIINLNAVLESKVISAKDFGMIACLPSVYNRAAAKTTMLKQIRSCELGFIAAVGDIVFNKDCEIIVSTSSVSFTGWNICAIMEAKLVSWFSQTNMQLGPCVITRAKVKANSKYWQTGTDETRFNYVKAVQ